MLNTTKSLHELIKSRYECQKRIGINNRHIKDLRSEGTDASFLVQENENLKKAVEEFNRTMEDKYSYSCQHINV